MNISNKAKGFVCGAVAAATYGMNPLFTLPLYKEGLSVDSVLFYRYAFAVLILGILMKIQGQSFALKKNEVLPLLAGGLLFSASSLLLFMSYKHMDAGIASTILFVYPVMVAVIMFLFFHEKISLLTVFCILMALSGIGMLYKGDSGETLSLIGMLLVILSSLSYAIYIVHTQNHVDSQTDFLCLAFRAVHLCSPSEFYDRSTGSSFFSGMGQYTGNGFSAYCYFTYLYGHLDT